MTRKRIFVAVEGIVQGVGFRPFVYNLALSKNLFGWVNNNSEGVYIDLEGEPVDIDGFLHELEFNPPPLARIEKITVEDRIPEGFREFVIKESHRQDSKITLISPDIATCRDCIEDIKHQNNRRHLYPFTNCTNCGPRFSIIKSIPYDRDKTTMQKFQMCRNCSEEYKNPLDRRFHAQPNACDSCGPHIFLLDKNGKPIEAVSDAEQEAVLSGNPCENGNLTTLSIFNWTRTRLKEGAIFAMKGLTGFHLVCDAEKGNAVKLLRARKRRPHKPFAVMMDSIETVKQYCEVSPAEEALLTGIRKPIVLLNKKSNYSLPDSIAPGQNSLGVMLPYTPLHEILFMKDVKVLIMTSANVHGLPLEYKNEDAVEHLDYLVDYFLMHDRDIHLPVDDSVSKVVLHKERLIRRARGYAPEPIRFKGVKPILACGSNMKNTFCIAKEDFLFPSQHNGDLENLETFEHYKRNIEHFKSIFSFQPEYAAADMHPDYYSTQYALSSNLPVIQVQHHHAHIVSCMVENSVKEKVIGISFDGTGYGTDGKIWGGEFLICDYKDFQRAGHTAYIKMPGGEKAILEPWRMAAAYLHTSSALNKNGICSLFGSEADTVIQMLEKNLNCIETSSMGRLFDAVSSILGICSKISFEGQASMELEALIEDGDSDDFYPYSVFEKEGLFIFDPSPVIKGLITDKTQAIKTSIMARRFHNSIVKVSVDICRAIRNKTGLAKTALSGGVFQNSYLLKNLTEALTKEGFTVYTHSIIPSNDGGVSIGQIIIANEHIKQEDAK
jgi:hydrogenase maturation protein HypF